MGRRLAIIRACAVCAQSFRPSHKEQATCSNRCGSIRRVKRHPQTATMIAANLKRRRDFLEQRKQLLAGLTNVECYALGVKDCFSRMYQRRQRETRRRA